MEHRAKKTSIVRTVGEWNDLELDVAFVIVERYSCNEMELSVLNVSRLTSLRVRNKQTNKQTNVTHIHGPVAAVNAHTLKASGSVTQLVSQLL